LPVQTHTGDNPHAAEEILDLLDAEGIGADAWIWVHAHQVCEPIHLVRAARRGAWISLDGVHPQRSERILGLCRALRQEGLLGQVLLSHDGNAYTADGACRPFDFLMTGFIPRLTEEGFSTAEVNTLTAANPRRALSIR
jgi:phosphotriesterase-related protein